MTKKLFVLSPLLIGGLIAYILLLKLYDQETNFDELALGDQTVSHFATVNGMPIHIAGAKNFESLKRRWQLDSKEQTVLILGNSQTHSINQMEYGETTYPALLSIELSQSNYKVLASSLPNANLQELYLVLAFLSKELQITHVTIPVFMDDLREDGIRAELITDIIDSDPDFLVNAHNPVANKINEYFKNNQKELASSSSQIASEVSIQEISEQHLNNWLDQNTNIWKMRGSVRGDLFNKLYIYRNILFGINAQTKRKLIKDSYISNMQAMKAILELCEQKNIVPVIYIPPIRYDVEIPYDENEYSNFKKEINILTQKHGFKVHNFEHAVPNNYWGTKASTTGNSSGEIDFMHFQFEGHQILAKKLKEQVL